MITIDDIDINVIIDSLSISISVAGSARGGLGQGRATVAALVAEACAPLLKLPNGSRRTLKLKIRARILSRQPPRSPLQGASRRGRHRRAAHGAAPLAGGFGRRADEAAG